MHYRLAQSALILILALPSPGRQPCWHRTPHRSGTTEEAPLEAWAGVMNGDVVWCA
ncbi:hypothetical protein [uncultured Pseudomonas sp.]|uniref:hypothetical protein n=1 Tax=uncultured Pseudomonas sp. TaxID=114707 RepID=UPI0025F84751|nr:hypothetical protein [uncultured Pseudomonas sp.]